LSEWDVAAGVAVFVDSSAFLGQVVAPVGVEVAVRPNSAELQDGLRSFGAPARAPVMSILFSS